MIKDYNKCRKAQSVLEYLIIAAVVITAVASSGFLRTVKSHFENHFNQCKGEILEK